MVGSLDFLDLKGNGSLVESDRNFWGYTSYVTVINDLCNSTWFHLCKHFFQNLLSRKSKPDNRLHDLTKICRSYFSFQCFLKTKLSLYNVIARS